jgi:hypothetical protein
MLRHDFRRTTARNMVNAGVPERVAMTVTGHRTRSMFDRYNIVSPVEQQAAARLIGTASDEASRRVAAAASVVTRLAPRLDPMQGTTRGAEARRGTVEERAITAEVLETASG